MDNVKVALIHDWLVSFGGSEQVLLSLSQLFPDAPIYTSLYDKSKLPEPFHNLKVITSGLQKFPGALSRHRLMLPLMPYAFEQFDLSQYDLVISSSHACAKGVITSPYTCHISYIHSPIRYAWDLYHSYLEHEGVKGLKRKVIAYLLHELRKWDQLSSMRVDAYICNSTYVQKRIRKYYRRESTIIHPPVSIENAPDNKEKESFYIVFSRLVSYKRIDLAVKVFNELGKPLVVIGDGPQRKKLEHMANQNIQFSGFVTEEQKWRYLSRAKALIYPGIEDFGIIPVEAQAAGCPVIAFSKGGIQDTVIPDKTGVMFKEQTVESLKKAILEFENKSFQQDDLKQFVRQFSKEEFNRKIFQFIQSTYNRFQSFN